MARTQNIYLGRVARRVVKPAFVIQNIRQGRLPSERQGDARLRLFDRRGRQAIAIHSVQFHARAIDGATFFQGIPLKGNFRCQRA